MEARKRTRAEEDAANERGHDSECQHTKRDDGEREEDEEGSRMDAIPDEMLEAVLLKTYTRGSNPSAAALVPLLFVCQRWNVIVRLYASKGAGDGVGGRRRPSRAGGVAGGQQLPLRR
jgi:hypothetical protein